MSAENVRYKSDDFQVFKSNWIVINPVQELLDMGFLFEQIDNQTMNNDTAETCVITNSIILNMMSK
tara:strand:+ start:46 stop:243 length:198 start_codon:yes stop_codon:yes gene_type:complete